jgi:hypothetical protein
MRARNQLWRAPDHRVGGSPTHVEEQKTFLSSSTPAHPARPRRGLRHRLTILASAAALSIVGLAAVTGTAYADEHQEITDSADPVTVNTPYNYIVTIIDPDFEFGFRLATIDLSGATANFTGTIISDDPSLECEASGTHAECIPQFDTGPEPRTITATVLPTATGTVIADTARYGMGPVPLARDSTTTEIIAGGSSDIDVNVTAQPHLGILVPYLTYTLTAHNTGPSAVTSATLTASLPPGASATNLSAGCTTTTGTVTCTYGAIANGASTAKSFRVPLHLLSLGHVSVTGVRTTSAPTDPNPANDTDTATCTVISIVLATCP